MKILFVCKYNRFRSKVAEAYFKKINLKIKVFSAGLILSESKLSSSEKERNKFIEEKYGLKLTTKFNPVSMKNLKDVDKIIVVASDIPKKMFNHPFYKDKVTYWKIKDDFFGDKKTISSSVDKIIKKVNNLVKELK